MKTTILLLLSGFLLSAQQNTTKVTITISNLRNAEGKIGLGIYKDQASFNEEQAYLQKVFSKSSTKNGVLTLTIQLSPDTYGIALLDDENANGEMDYGWVLPDEGFGFSNYYHTGFTKPVFADFSFEVDKKPKDISIKVRYM